MLTAKKGFQPGFVVFLSILVVLLVTPACAGAESGTWHFYFGHLHSHTSYSDGALAPEDAYAHARDAAGLDFLGITEHGYYMFENPGHWQALLETAKRFNEPGRFVAFRGTEWTHGAGHISVIEAPEPCSRDEQISFSDLVSWMQGKGGIASFNHPGRNEQGNWDDFRFSLAGNKTIRLLEVGSGPYARNTFYEASYIRALDRGWQLGAINSQDNHRADWGTAADTRTGVVAGALTREDIIEALRAMRTYSSEDRNARVRFTGNGEWMGSTLPLGQVQFEVDVSDPDPADAVHKVEVKSNRGVVIREFRQDDSDSAPGRAFHKVFTVDPGQGYNWYYLRIEQEDGDVIITSPIWVRSPSDLMIVDLRFDVGFPKKGAPGHLRGEVVNLGESVKSGVIVEFIASSHGSRIPIGAVRIDVGAGETRPISLKWASPVSGDMTVTANIVDPAMPSYARNTCATSVRILPEDLPKVMVDEGHNNRASGFAGKFLEVLATVDFEGMVNPGRITAELLKDVSLLVIANPEPGVSLVPTTFDDSEILAIRDFVFRGGGLLLAGASDASDALRSVEQLNAILASIGSAMRFSDDEVWSGTGLEATATVLCTVESDCARCIGEAPRPVRMTQACSIADASFGELSLQDGVVVFATGGAGTRSVDTNGKGPHYLYESSPVLCAGQEVGRGRVVAVGAPLYSIYDLRPNLGNQEFVIRLVTWLLRH